MAMKKNCLPFIAGMACMVLLTGGIGGSRAAVITTADHPAGEIAAPALEKVYAGQAGVALFGEQWLAPGTGRTNGQGAEVPAVLTYVDDTGAANYYVSAETVVELLDIAGGVVYNKELNCVDFGNTIHKGIMKTAAPEGSTEEPESRPYENYWTYKKSYGGFAYNKEGDPISKGVGRHQPKSVTVQSADGSAFTVSGGNGASKKESHLEDLSEEERALRLVEIEAVIQRRRTSFSTTPTYGVSDGAYTEIDPAEVDRSAYLGAFMYHDIIQAEEINTMLEFAPYAGTCGLITIENQGEDDILVDLDRQPAIGMHTRKTFVRVLVPKGQTLERAFRVEDVAGAELKNVLELGVESCDPDIPVKVVVSAEQYRGTLS